MSGASSSLFASRELAGRNEGGGEFRQQLLGKAGRKKTRRTLARRCNMPFRGAEVVCQTNVFIARKKQNFRPGYSCRAVGAKWGSEVVHFAFTGLKYGEPYYGASLWVQKDPHKSPFLGRHAPILTASGGVSFFFLSPKPHNHLALPSTHGKRSLSGGEGKVCPHWCQKYVYTCVRAPIMPFLCCPAIRLVYFRN